MEPVDSPSTLIVVLYFERSVTLNIGCNRMSGGKSRQYELAPIFFDNLKWNKFSVK